MSEYMRRVLVNAALAAAFLLGHFVTAMWLFWLLLGGWLLNVVVYGVQAYRKRHSPDPKVDRLILDYLKMLRSQKASQRP